MVDFDASGGLGSVEVEGWALIGGMVIHSVQLCIVKG